MANFDPLLKRETWCMQNTGQTNGTGDPCYAMMAFKFVEYDSSPDRYLEPMSWSPFFHASFGSAGSTNVWTPTNPVTDGTLITGFEFFNSAIINDVHEFHFA